MQGHNGPTAVFRGLFLSRVTMSDISEEASKLFRQIEPTSPMTEYQREQQAIRENLQRLRAERLATEVDRIRKP